MTEENMNFKGITFDLPKNQSNVIKVIGVGGGGSNAINHMFKQGIKGVDFVICNTDSQALNNSPVPTKIQLGVNLTEGLGAGSNPEVGQQSAIESIADIEKMLDTNTKMVFITAGMGGGTGTGAAPVIAQLAKERDILTVGIVTIPFQFEGKIRIEQAKNGVEKLRQHVDSLIVINNNKLREVYGNLGFKAGFSKADEVLSTASRGIAEVITHHYTQNIDLKDAKTVLSNSGRAIMGSATASGDDRARKAIIDALDSPLLNDNKITGAKNVLLLVVSGTNEITIDEIGEINDYIQSEAGHNANIIMGVGEDESLGEAVAVTVIATGFNPEQQDEIGNTEPKKTIHSLEDEQRIEQNLSKNETVFVSQNIFDRELDAQSVVAKESDSQKKVVFRLDDESQFATNERQEELKEETLEIIQPKQILTTDYIKNIDVEFEIVPAKIEETITFESIATEQTETQEPTRQVVFELTDEIKAIEINEAVQLVPVTDINELGVKKYFLEDYTEVEQSLLNSKPQSEQIKKTEPEELNFMLKQQEETLNPTKRVITETPSSEDISIMEMSIEEVLKARADERRQKMKEFNYKFQINSVQRIEELEREPAYKRQNIDLSQRDSDLYGNSRTSLSLDSNNDLQLRNNNSFLHDNVD